MRHVALPLLLASASLAVVSLAASVAVAQKAAGPARGGAHGAMAFDAQQKALDALKTDPTGKLPDSVDPTYFATLVAPDNALDAKRIALGRSLYFDPRLSRDGTVACATCHDVSRGFTDRRPLSEGIGGKVGRRNAPTTLNAAFFSSQFLDGRAATLEEQALLPITNPIEMGMPNIDVAVAAIAKDPAVVQGFKDAYGRAPNSADLGRALASFQRTLLFVDAPFDRFLLGDAKALSNDAKAGFALFNGKGRCTACHQLGAVNPLGTDNRFHNIGVSARHQDFEGLAKRAIAELERSGASKEVIDRLALETDLSELGRFVVTRNRADVGAFKTSQLRNVGITAPYMHDGSMQTMWDVIDHYNKGGEANGYLDGGIEPLALSDKEVDQLVAFMFALTDTRFASDNAAELARQKALAAKQRPFRDEKLATRKTLQFEARLAQKPPPAPASSPAKNAPAPGGKP